MGLGGGDTMIENNPDAVLRLLRWLVRNALEAKIEATDRASAKHGIYIPPPFHAGDIDRKMTQIEAGKDR